MNYFVFLTLIGVFGYVTSIANKALEDVLNANLAFAFDAYKILAKEPGNILFSPISATSLLALAYVGSSGNTSLQMAKALSLPKNHETVSSGFKEYIENDLSMKDFTLANKIYIANTFEIHPNYKQVAVDNFGADVESMNFANSAAAAKTINDWIAEQTHQHIKNAIAPENLDSFTSMVLVNAAYFEGTWRDTFDAEVSPIDFHVGGNVTRAIPAMERETIYASKKDQHLRATIIEIPYKQRMSMMLIVPHDVNGLAEVEAKLPIHLKQCLYGRSLRLKMPIFSTSMSINLEKVVTKLGMEDAFSSKADFSKISDQHLQVTNIQQKTFISVTENGTRAAAETDLGFGARSLIQRTFHNFTVDRPFLYLIHRKSVSDPLFIGRYTGMD